MACGFGARLEHLLDTENGRNKRIHLLVSVVECKGGTASAFDAEAMHERFGTVVARTDSYAETVEEGAHVEVMDGPHLKTDDGIMEGRVFGTENLHAFYLVHTLHGIGCEVTFVGLDDIQTYRTNIVEGTGETCGGDIVGRACLELVGKVVERGVLEGNSLYHLTTAHVGWDAVEPLFLTIEYADTRGTIYLVTAEGKEVAIQVLHVDAEVGRALGSIDEDGDIVGMSYADDVLDGIDGAEYIADVCERDEASAVIDKGLDIVEA